MLKRLDPMAWVCLLFVLAVVLAAVLAPQIVGDPNQANVYVRLKPPSAEYPLGTDNLGRDLLARLVYGARVSLIVGAIPVAGAALIGGTAGLVSAYVGGRIDLLIMRIIDVILALPGLVLVLAISALMGQGLFNVIVAITVIYVPVFARLMHGQTLSLRERDYVQAARSLGASDLRIMLVHILPNAMTPMVIQASIAIGQCIVIESSLSFLGVGVAPPTSSWGGLLRDGYPFMERAPWLSIYPGLAIFVLVLAFSILGDVLRSGRRAALSK